MSTLMTDAFWASRFSNPALGAKLLRKDGIVPLLSSAIAHSYPLITVSGNPISIADGAGGQSVESCVVSFSPIQASGTPSPDNVLPITGWSSVGVWRTGTNVWDEEWVNGYINDSGVFTSRSDIVGTKNAIPVLPNTTYYWYRNNVQGFISFWKNGASYNSLDADDFISRVSYSNDVTTFTTPSNCHAIHFNMVAAYGSTYANNISVNYPATVTSYVASKGITSVTASFGSTYYAGTIDLVSGVGSVTHGMVDLGTLSWTKEDNHFYSGYVTTAMPPANNTTVANIVSDRYKTVTFYVLTLETTDCSIAMSNTRRLYVYDSRYTDAESFKTAMSGVMLCYELATPISFTVDAQTLQTLQGDNVFFTDSNGTITLTYRQDA